MSKGRDVGGTLFALVALVIALQGCGGGGDSGRAHVNQDSGSTNGAVLDERAGTIPPPTKKIDLMKAAQAAHCYLLRNVPPRNDKEIAADAPASEYASDPPLSGPHVAPPHQQADGAYMVMPDESATVASLDHGRMTIQYAPDFPEEIQSELKGLYDTMYGGTLLFPNGNMQYAVAVTTWGNLLGCTGYEGAATLNAIRAFGKATWGKSGDVPVDRFPVEGPTPASPQESGSAE